MSPSSSLVIVAALIAAPALARAQAAPPPSPPAAPGPPGAQVPGAEADPAAPAYEAAFAALVHGDLSTAAAGFRDVAARATDPDRASRARELGRLVDQLVAGHVRIVPGGALSDAERDDQDDGRTSLIVWSTILGLYGGVVVIDDADINDARVGVATIAAGTAIGLFGSYFATDGRPITGAEADAYSLGMIEGAANAGLLVHPIGLAGSSGTVQTTLFVTSAAGAVTGLGYARAFRPARGQVAFAGSLSLLGAASTGLGIGIAQPRLDGDQWVVAIAAGTDAGLGLGLGLGRNLDWSVSRGRLVQLGVLLGGLTGAAAGALITGTDTAGDTTARTLSATTLGGMWGGFALAVHLTDGMRTDRSFRTGAITTTLAPLPVRGGGGVALVGAF